MVHNDVVSVFCKKCKYYNRYSNKYCKRVLEVTETVTPYEIKDVKTHARPDRDNKDNMCKYYQYDLLSKILEIIITIFVMIVVLCLILVMVNVI